MVVSKSNQNIYFKKDVLLLAYLYQESGKKKIMGDCPSFFHCDFIFFGLFHVIWKIGKVAWLFGIPVWMFSPFFMLYNVHLQTIAAAPLSIAQVWLLFCCCFLLFFCLKGIRSSAATFRSIENGDNVMCFVLWRLGYRPARGTTKKNKHLYRSPLTYLQKNLHYLSDTKTFATQPLTKRNTSTSQIFWHTKAPYIA